MDRRTLKRYKSIITQIDLLEQERQRLLAGVIGAAKLGGSGGFGSGIADKTGDIAVRIADLDRLIGSKLDILIALRIRIEQAIAALPDETDALLMRLRYINCLQWSEIEREMDYCYGTLALRHKKALLWLEGQDN